MNPEEVTFEKLPLAVAHLIREISIIREKLDQMVQIPSNKKELIDIDRACLVLMKARSTVYTLVHKRLIPSYKLGKRLYFYEDELVEWINKTRKKTMIEIMDEIESEMHSKNKYRKK